MTTSLTDMTSLMTYVYYVSTIKLNTCIYIIYVCICIMSKVYTRMFIFTGNDIIYSFSGIRGVHFTAARETHHSVFPIYFKKNFRTGRLYEI